MNRLRKKFQDKQRDILNVYFTAGHPSLDSILKIVPALEKNGVDLVEIGMPYSDPLADGTTIQGSSKIALENGMSLQTIFDQVTAVRAEATIPIILMGYFNQVLQFGVEKFLKNCADAGVDGLIIPDLPMAEYEQDYKGLFEKHGLQMTFLVSPQTSDERIKKAAELSTGFLYVIAQSSITGGKGTVDNSQLEYFKKIESLKGDASSLIGFGIHDRKTFASACEHGNGAIVGSEFIRRLGKVDAANSLEKVIGDFVAELRG